MTHCTTVSILVKIQALRNSIFCQAQRSGFFYQQHTRYVADDVTIQSKLFETVTASWCTTTQTLQHHIEIKQNTYTHFKLLSMLLPSRCDIIDDSTIQQDNNKPCNHSSLRYFLQKKNQLFTVKMQYYIKIKWKLISSLFLHFFREKKKTLNWLACKKAHTIILLNGKKLSFSLVELWEYRFERHL